ncbi:MAG: hypothetical protein ACI9B2_000844 [Flavobacteriales bacterium]|jgi:hypothetical protein|tara:strand:- start:343 stop:1080 length:738 start_codon:yes stop_codon:yes gene_type:complete
MKIVFKLLLILFSFSISAQEHSKFSLEFGGGISQFSMQTLNEDFLENSSVFEKGIHSGVNYFSAIKYKPTALFNIGLYVNYTNGGLRNSLDIPAIDITGEILDTLQMKAVFSTNAYVVGLSSNIDLGKVLGFEERLKRFSISTEYNLGFFLAYANFDYWTLEYPDIITDYQMISNGLQGQLAITTSYRFNKNPIVRSIGLKLGYQLMKTNTLVDNSTKEEWLAFGSPIHLDYSGYYTSLYFVIGK